MAYQNPVWDEVLFVSVSHQDPEIQFGVMFEVPSEKLQESCNGTSIYIYTYFTHIYHEHDPRFLAIGT